MCLKTGVKEIPYKYIDWIYFSLDRDLWPAFVNMVMNPQAMPWLRWLVASFSLQKSVCVGFVVEKVALGQVFLKDFDLPHSASFHQTKLHAQSLIIDAT